ncbi:MAG: UDP-Glycosyltransferase/glycogen phosphorylase, partial [Frankiales bacterium]|nr:UDP-Glycosyltransferase/glycogen phosphorylase [Frankiales bacterium]
APDVLLLAAQRLLEQDPSLAGRLQVAVVGGPSGSGVDEPELLHRLASQLDVNVRFEAPAGPDRLRDWDPAADLVAVPSHNESFGLVALEAQACGTPVVAARVGGLSTTVADGISGLLVDGHDPLDWAAVLGRALDRRAELSAGALAHAAGYSWERTASGLLQAYRDVLAAPLAAIS